MNKAVSVYCGLIGVNVWRTKFLLFNYCLLLAGVVFAQDPMSLFEEGKQLERKYKEEEALEKYKQAFSLRPDYVPAAVKAAELSGNMGNRASGTVAISAWMNQGLGFAEAAFQADTSSALAAGAMALAYKNLAITEVKRDKATDFLKLWRKWAEKSLVLDSSYGKAAYLLGSWHLEVLTQGEFRKASIKLLYGGLPAANINNAIALMEFCKEKEPYYCPNFLDLGKAYHYHKNYEKAIQTLERLAVLPTRRLDDKAVKEEGALLLQKLK